MSCSCGNCLRTADVGYRAFEAPSISQNYWDGTAFRSSTNCYPTVDRCTGNRVQIASSYSNTGIVAGPFTHNAKTVILSSTFTNTTTAVTVTPGSTFTTLVFNGNFPYPRIPGENANSVANLSPGVLGGLTATSIVTIEDFDDTFRSVKVRIQITVTNGTTSDIVVPISTTPYSLAFIVGYS